MNRPKVAMNNLMIKKLKSTCDSSQLAALTHFFLEVTNFPHVKLRRKREKNELTLIMHHIQLFELSRNDADGKRQKKLNCVK